MSTKDQRQTSRLTDRRVRNLMVNALAEYHESYVLPLEQRLEAMERPWYRKAWDRIRGR